MRLVPHFALTIFDCLRKGILFKFWIPPFIGIGMYGL